jgi:hypothetical protein
VADQQDLTGSRATNQQPSVPWDRAIFTSLPSNTGEGYRFVAWSTGVRVEERQELTRRAPSHGSLCAEETSGRGLLRLHLQSSGRRAWGLVRVSGAEHTRRGGGRVWTDFLLRDAGGDAHPSVLRAALAAAPPPKPPIGSAALTRIALEGAEAPAPAGGQPARAAQAAAVAALLVEGRPCVVAAGADPASLLEDAMHMVPSSLRGAVSASAGLRFSLARGVRTTITDRIDAETLRATKGQGVECLDLASKVPPAPPALEPWLALMTAWWGDGRAAEAATLSARVGVPWRAEDLARIAAVAASVARGELSREALEDFLASRAA